MKRLPLILLTALALLVPGACRSPKPPMLPHKENDDPTGTGNGRGDNAFSRQRALVRGLRQHTFSSIGANVDPALSPDGSRLYFASTHLTKQHDIFYKENGLPRLVQKTFSPADDRSPRISPDGRWIVFISNRRGNWDLFRVSTGAGGKETRLTDDDSDEIHPSWSPDGRMIVYSARNRRSGRWELRILDLSTRTTMIMEGVEGLFPEWSPDGRKIVFQRSRTRAPRWYALWTIDVDGTNLTELVSSESWAAISPSWSPDSKYVIFATVAKSLDMRRQEMTADDIWIVGADGVGLTQLTVGIEAEWSPTIAADGRVYFCSTRSGHKNIWSMELSLLDITHIESTGGKVLPPIQIPAPGARSARSAEPKPESGPPPFDMLSELESWPTEGRK